MARDKFKDVTIGANKYRVGLVNASIGSWIVLQVTGGKSSEYETFTKIQNYLFNLISVYRDDSSGSSVPLRIFDNGKWLCPELELDYDLEAVNDLFTAAMEFNFDPFFARLKKEVDSAKTLALSQPLSPKI